MKYLFERLGQHRTAAFDVKRAVRDNVQRLLGNRVTVDVEAAPDVLGCGLPSVVELTRGDRAGLARYAARIRRLIEHYEPRLEAPHVEFDAAGARPYRIVVSAGLATADGTEELRFPVSLRAEG